MHDTETSSNTNEGERGRKEKSNRAKKWRERLKKSSSPGRKKSSKRKTDDTIATESSGTEEDARQRAKELIQLKSEHLTEWKAKEEARLKAKEAEEARLKAEEEEARLRAKEKARLKAKEEEEARRKGEEARVKTKEESRVKTKADTRRKAEEAAREMKERPVDDSVQELPASEEDDFVKESEQDGQRKVEFESKEEEEVTPSEDRDLEVDQGKRHPEKEAGRSLPEPVSAEPPTIELNKGDNDHLEKQEERFGQPKSRKEEVKREPAFETHPRGDKENDPTMALGDNEQPEASETKDWQVHEGAQYFREHLDDPKDLATQRTKLQETSQHSQFHSFGVEREEGNETEHFDEPHPHFRQEFEARKLKALEEESQRLHREVESFRHEVKPQNNEPEVADAKNQIELLEAELRRLRGNTDKSFDAPRRSSGAPSVYSIDRSIDRREPEGRHSHR